MLFSETFQRRMLTSCLWAALFLAVLGAVLIGAEYDETWIISSARQAFDADAIPKVRPVTTTGGLHFLLVGPLHWLPIPPLLLPRAISLLSAVGLFYIIARHLAPWTENAIERRIVLVTCLAAPGVLLLAGMGYGVMLATLLFMAGMFAALGSERISPGAALLGGVLIGAAVATRWTLIPALPAILLWACCSREHLRHNILMSLLGGLAAVAVFAGCLALQVALIESARAAGDGVSMTAGLRAAGASRELTPPARMFSFLVRLVTTLPLTLILLAAFAYVVLGQQSRARRLVLVLLGAAALITAAWIVRSPWMHLRYIWPVYLMVAICAGLGLATLHRIARTSQRPELALLAVGLPVLLAGTQMLIAIRVIAIGAGMQVNSAGYENIEYHFKPFHHIQEQWKIVSHLKSLAPDTVIGTIRIPFEYGANELAFLSGRNVIDYARTDEDSVPPRPDYILVHRFSPLNETGQDWVDTLGAPVREIEGYTLYDMPETAEIPDADDVTLDPQLDRFTLEKRLSLSWY